MRRARTRSADDPAGRADPAAPGIRRANGWPVVPLRLFLAALFCFAGYAKFAYPRFFDPASPNGFKAAVDAAREGDTPLGRVMGPLSDHASLFGHVTACAEIAIGLGLLVGLLTRLAALGGMVLTALIVLSINWNGVKEYTGSSGWFTSVELAVAAALSVFLLGGAGPFALDNLFIRARERQRARDDAEPGFRDSELEDSRRRLRGEQAPMYEAGGPSAGTATVQGAPTAQGAVLPPAQGPGTATAQGAGTATTPLPTAPTTGYRSSQQDDEYRDDPEPEPNSLWTEGRRYPGQQPPAEPRRDVQPPDQAGR
jgi:uncharacterized membrane protein YphA (DoxX/SURF4 family)